MDDDKRVEELKNWLKDDLKIQFFSFEPASSDASFRRYFRITKENQKSYIVMDAPPDKEDSRPFVALNIVFDSLGVNVPEIHNLDLDKGFILLEDFGSDHYLDNLSEENMERLYGDALKSLVKAQSKMPLAPELIKDYSRDLLIREMELFREWLLLKHFDISISDYENEIIDNAFQFLADIALEQPKVLVHRDYHSRNLMVLEEDSPGVIDYQDAVIGPITYDLVSLLKDCYISWPAEKVLEILKSYFEHKELRKHLKEVSFDKFIRWFETMGIQRHLKASGIFARLNYRDGKEGYLKDIPRTLNYIAEVVNNYEELAMFAEFFMQRVIPCYVKDLERPDWGKLINDK